MQEKDFICQKCKKEIKVNIDSKYKQVKCEYCESQFDDDIVEQLENVKYHLESYRICFHEKDINFVANKLFSSGAGSRDIYRILKDNIDDPDDSPLIHNKRELKNIKKSRTILLCLWWLLGIHRLITFTYLLIP